MEGVQDRGWCGEVGRVQCLFRWNRPSLCSLSIETRFFGVLSSDQNIESSFQLTRILRRSIWNFIPKMSAHVIMVFKSWLLFWDNQTEPSGPWQLAGFLYWFRRLSLQMPDLQSSQVLLQSNPSFEWNVSKSHWLWPTGRPLGVQHEKFLQSPTGKT